MHCFQADEKVWVDYDRLKIWRRNCIPDWGGEIGALNDKLIELESWKKAEKSSCIEKREPKVG